jgi:hypothetical protein
MSHRHRAAARLGLAFVALAGFGPAVQAPPPVERLSVFEGTWTREDVPAGATFRETCAWLAGGRRHLVCQTEFQSASRTAQMIKVHSYRQETYVVYAVMGDGQAWTYTGGPDGDRWIFNVQSNRPNDPRRLRIVITPAKDRVRFVEESSTNNGPWQTTEDYTYVRVK